MFHRKIGTPKGLVRIVHNGVSRGEFAPVVTAPDATDLVFLGELRHLKGIHVLIDAIAQLHRDGRNVTATLVGDGPDRAGLQGARRAQRLERRGTMPQPAMPARRGQRRWRQGMVVPSRAESLPYVVLETAAGGKPLITTKVGGIPEIYGTLSNTLFLLFDPMARWPGPSPRPSTARTPWRKSPKSCASGYRRLFGRDHG